MNPEDQIARQALIARMGGAPMPATTQISPQAGVQTPTPQVVPQNPVKPGDRQMGDMTRTPNESDKLAKAVLPGTVHQDPHIQALSKVMLTKLIPYLGHGASQQTP